MLLIIVALYLSHTSSFVPPQSHTNPATITNQFIHQNTHFTHSNSEILRINRKIRPINPCFVSPHSHFYSKNEYVRVLNINSKHIIPLTIANPNKPQAQSTNQFIQTDMYYSVEACIDTTETPKYIIQSCTDTTEAPPPQTQFIQHSSPDSSDPHALITHFNSEPMGFCHSSTDSPDSSYPHALITHSNSEIMGFYHGSHDSHDSSDPYPLITHSNSEILGFYHGSTDSADSIQHNTPITHSNSDFMALARSRTDRADSIQHNTPITHCLHYSQSVSHTECIVFHRYYRTSFVQTLAHPSLLK